MPSYRTHVSVNLFVGLPLAWAALKYAALPAPTEIFAFSAAFIYGTFFLHPDLDLTRNIRLFSLKGIFSLPFRPYSYLFRHRGISHLPLIGTLTRVVWLGIFLILLGWTFAFDRSTLWFCLGGIAVADLFHVALDQLF